MPYRFRPFRHPDRPEPRSLRTMSSSLPAVFVESAFLSAFVVTSVAPLHPLPAQEPQEPQEPVDRAAIDRLVDEGTTRSQALALFRTLTESIGPRLTGSPAHREAAEWSRARFEEWGLANARLEAFEFGRGWTLEGLVLEMTGPRYMPLVGYPEAWTPSTDGVLEGPPVYVGELTEAQIRDRADEITGGIVLATPPQPAFIREDRPQPSELDGPVRIGAPRTLRPDPPVGRRAMARLLAELRAGAALRPSQGAHGTIFVLGNEETPNDAVPTVVLAGEHYNRVVRMVQDGLPVRLRVGVDVRYHEDDPSSYNVLAEIPGADPDIGDEVVMVGAHLDSWHSSPGATDNADGSTAVLEAARILAALEIRPRRTIRFALWGGEEQGLFGSRAWVERHLAGDANQDARERFSVYFNQDIGGGATYGLYLQDNEEAAPILDAWIAALEPVGARRNVRASIGSSDHMSFEDLGLPGFSTVQDYTDYDTRTHHTNQDFFERLTEEDLRQSSIVLATLLYHAAMRDELMPRKPLEGGDDG